MAQSENRVILVGNLGTEPEVRDAAHGTMAKLRLCVTENKKTPSGWEEIPHWFTVVTFGNTADRMSELGKGDKVFVSGRLQAREFTTRDGERKTSVEVKGEKVFAMGRPVRKGPQATSSSGDRFADRPPQRGNDRPPPRGNERRQSNDLPF